LIWDFSATFPDAFSYEGNWAVLFAAVTPIEDSPPRLLIANALIYISETKKAPALRRPFPNVYP